jgi:uncharacterized protein (DUF58 family)
MRQAEIQLQHRIILYLIPVVFINQLLSPRKVWMILLVGLLVSFAFSYYWAVSLKENLNLKREMRFGWSRVGDHLQERFVLENNARVPAPWIYLEDHSDLPGYTGSRIVRIGGKSVRKWFERGTCERRGLYTIGPTTIHTGDPLGIFKVAISYPGTSNMMVMPPIFRLPEIRIAPGGRIGDGANISHSWEEAVTVSGVREYHPGDSLRHIHWPTSARKGDLFVRSYDNTPTSDQWIFLDMNARVHAGEGQDASEEHGVILAASLMNWSLENGRPVGFGSNGRKLSWYQPRLEETQKWVILRALALLALGDQPYRKLLDVARKSIRFRSSVILITPDSEGTWLDPLLMMRKNGIIPTVLLLNSLAFGGQGAPDQLQEKLIASRINHLLIGPDYLNSIDEQISSLTKTPQKETRQSRKASWRPII